MPYWLAELLKRPTQATRERHEGRCERASISACAASGKVCVPQQVFTGPHANPFRAMASQDTTPSPA